MPRADAATAAPPQHDATEPTDGSAIWLGEMRKHLERAGIDPLSFLKRIASIQDHIANAIAGAPEKAQVERRARFALSGARLSAAAAVGVYGWWAGATVADDVSPAEGLKVVIDADQVDYTEQLGQHGVPWGWGTLRFDPNDDLQPYYARGRGGDLGVWHDHLNTPPVEQGIMKPVRALAGLTWRPRPAQLDEYADDADRALARKHWEYCCRCLDRWGPKAVGDLVEQILRNVPAFGFQLWELMGERTTLKVDGAAGEYLAFTPPVWISHNALEYWLISREELVGCIFDFSHSVDADGTTGPVRKPIGREKLMWIGYRADGSNYEGRGALRAHYSQTEMYRAFLELQALAAEINGLGDRVVIGPEKSGQSVRAAITEWMNSFVARTVPWAYLPHGSQYMLTAPNTGQVDFTPVLNFLKAEIAAVHDSTSELVGIIHSAGSFALKKDASAQGQKNYQYVVTRLIAQPVAEELFLPFLRLAFPEDPVHYAPLLLTEDVGATDDVAWVNGVVAAQGGGLLDRQDSIGRAVRSRFGLDEDLEVVDEGEVPAAADGRLDDALAKLEALLAEHTRPGVKLADAPVRRTHAVVGRDGRTFMASRPLRDSERHLALADIEDLLDSAEQRAAAACQRVAADHLALVVDELGEGLVDVPDADKLSKLESKARARLEPAYLAAIRPELRRVANEGARHVREEVEDAGLNTGALKTADATDAADAHAALVATEAFNRTHGHIVNALLGEGVEETPAESTYRSIIRKRVNWVFSAARRRTLEVNEDVLAGDTVERVSVLDGETCGECEDLDGTRVALGSAAMARIQPPRRCEGRGNCRCAFVLVGRQEGT